MYVHPGKSSRLILLAFLPLLLSTIPLPSADQQYGAASTVKITVLGTSNIHDWDLNSDKGSCNMTVQLDASGNLSGVSNLAFTLPVNTLKSKHGSQMDNNAYKAMNAGTYPNVTFKSSSVTVKPVSAGNYTLTAPGKLSISSGSRDVTLSGSCKLNSDKSLTITGSYKLKTTDYNVKPISIMLGAIKTGPDVTIQYNLTAKPQ